MLYSKKVRCYNVLVKIYKEYVLDTILKQSSQVQKSSVPKKFSIYVNGQNLETSTAYFKEDVLMLPVGSIAVTIGYQVEYRHQDNYTKIYKTSCFDSDAILIRYSYIHDDDTVFYYYSKGAQYFSIDTPPEVKNNELYVPKQFFELVLGCSITVSYSGNIAIDSSN